MVGTAKELLIVVFYAFLIVILLDIIFETIVGAYKSFVYNRALEKQIKAYMKELDKMCDNLAEELIKDIEKEKD